MFEMHSRNSASHFYQQPACLHADINNMIESETMTWCIVAMHQTMHIIQQVSTAFLVGVGTPASNILYCTLV